MLRLSTKVQYGVRAMFEIARDYKTGPITIREISKRQDVSISYLEQLLNQLRKGGLITSQKGPGGGYTLSRKPEEINIGEILNILEGPIAITQCLDTTDTSDCGRVDGCVARLLWKSLGEKISGFLTTITLKDLLKEEAKLEG
ncbi:MAG: RrF2 family transcriptional regulator [Nitrospirae bacterium]|nr:RrF2 family transcriptional regulator [Nitrospirota bacterium]